MLKLNVNLVTESGYGLNGNQRQVKALAKKAKLCAKQKIALVQKAKKSGALQKWIAVT